MMYNKQVEIYFFNPEHIGCLDVRQPLCVHVRNGQVGHSDFFDWYLRCDMTGEVCQVAFKVYGNPYLVAAIELVCQHLKGMQIAEHPKFGYNWIIETLSIPQAHYPVALQVEDGYREMVLKMKTELEKHRVSSHAL